MEGWKDGCYVSSVERVSGGKRNIASDDNGFPVEEQRPLMELMDAGLKSGRLDASVGSCLTRQCTMSYIQLVILVS